MDQPSRARYAAYLHGRVAEYDDTVAVRAEQKLQRGEHEPPSSHSHHETPLADPQVYARRRAAAAKQSAKSKQLSGKKRADPA
jgi:hypothetical protein